MSERKLRERPQESAPAGRSPLLRARGIHKAFQMGESRIEVLRDVDFELASGELVALVGKSGAGKSTLLHVLGLLDRPDTGSVHFGAEDAWRLSVQRRAELRNRSLGFVFQFYHLLPELDALENVCLPAMIGESPAGYRAKRGAIEARARELLERFGVGHRTRHRPAQLSGGERQRVAMARALIHDPAVLLADEPTGNLDSATGERVLELLLAEQARRGLSMVLVTHDERVARNCGRVVHMRDGRVDA
jgi:lipoprotein-releasing system ATP-binding protein